MAIKASDQVSIVDVTDAYSITLTSEAYTFVGGTSGVASGATCSTQAVAFCGTNQCNNVTVDSTKITVPKGISATVSNSGSSAVTITFTTTATISNACEATIPVSVDGITVNKKFSFAVAKAGSNGSSVSVKSTSVTYAKSTSGTTTPKEGWQSTVPSVSAGEYLWTKTVVTYSDGKSTTSYSVSRNGTNGTNGTNGKDAITLSITSSNGTVFKNSSGSTVLTAHVYKGGTELSITDAGVVANSLGSIKWYVGSSTTAVATSKTLTVSASDVTNAVVYTCQLEG